MEVVRPLLPVALWENNYDYPPSLFNDRLLKFDGCEDEIYIPLKAADKPLLMARYAVVSELDLPNEEDTKIKLARNEVEAGFASGIRKVWRGYYDTKDGLTIGDIEIAAELLEVYDLVFPYKPSKKMLKVEAEEMEREARLNQGAEAIADAYEQSIDENELLTYSAY